MTKLCVVLDIGKTNVKIHVIDDKFDTHYSRTRPNSVVNPGLYPHFDIPGLWRWVCETLSEITRKFYIDVISITTHGATAALVHSDAGDSGLVLPVMDYEYEGPAMDPDYNAIRPPFAETLSPQLPAGLNLGRQLFWQQRYFEPAFAEAAYILPYPQYWAWRLTGIAVSEVTSWGCHSDLWAPRKGDYSTLVDQLGLREKLPFLAAANSVIGCVSNDVVKQTGLPGDCTVIAGVHDSNASYLRYLSRQDNTPFTVISTGTWTVCFSPETPLESLDESNDMLANVDIKGRPVACARFMGGRDFDAICQRTGSNPQGIYSADDLQHEVTSEVYALPNFSEGSGPFGGRRAEILGQTANGTALASLYSALMLDYVLDLLGCEGELIMEGAWLRNRLLCQLLAQLRTEQPLVCSTDPTGTVTGAAQLALGGAPTTRWLEPVSPTALEGLDDYRDRWRDLLFKSASEQ